MKKPNITPGEWTLEPGRNFSTQSGTFYLTYGRDKNTSLPHFSSPTELDANARAIAAVPELLEALEMVHWWIIGSLPKGRTSSDCLRQMREALEKAGYTFD